MQSEVQPADLEELRAALIEFLDFLQAHSRRSPHFQRYVQQMLKSTDQCIRNGGHGMEEFNRHLLHDWQAALSAAADRIAAAQSAGEAVGAVFDAVRAFQEQNRSIFSDEGARSSAAGALQSRHAQLRAQIAALLEEPCRRFSNVPDSAFLAEFTAENVLSWSGEDIAFPQLWTLLERVFIRQAK